MKRVITRECVINVSVLMPCLSDADTAAELLQEAYSFLRKQDWKISFLVVDDGSNPPLAAQFQAKIKDALMTECIEVLELKRNLGHQRAIAAGLCYLSEKTESSDVIVVMDSDGEDSPCDISVLIENLLADLSSNTSAVFAERARRTEGIIFWLGYMSYLSLHRVLVGHAPRIGNFSAISKSMLEGLVTDPDLWSHYAASIWKSRAKRKLIPLARGTRRRGSSHLGLGGLILHGLSAITCYRETLALRLLIGAIALFLLSFVTLLASVALAPVGQIILVSGLIAIIMLALAILAFSQCFLVMQSRHHSTVIPVREYRYYVRKIQRIS